MKRANRTKTSTGKHKKCRRQNVISSSDESDIDTANVGGDEQAKSPSGSQNMENINLPGTSSSTRASGNKDNKYKDIFKISGIGEKQAECLLCFNKGAVSVLKMKDSNTSGLLRHLQRVHPNEPAAQKIIDPIPKKPTNAE